MILIFDQYTLTMLVPVTQSNLGNIGRKIAELTDNSGIQAIFRTILYSALSIFFFLLSGCAQYSSLESLYSDNADNIAASTAMPDEKGLSLKAEQIVHPLLKPLEINFSDGISLDETAVIAVIANPSLKSERDKKQIAAAQLIQAGLLPNPQLSLSYEIPTGGLTQGTFNAYGIGMDWEITALITREARLSAAGFNQKAVELEVAWKEWQTAEAARLHWLRLYWDLKKSKLMEEWSGAMGKRVRVLSDAVNQGVETAPALASARTALLEIQAGIAKNMELIQQEEAELIRVMGLPPDYDLVLQKMNFSVPLHGAVINQIDNAPENIMNKRLDIMALRSACRSNDEHVRETVLSQFPKIGIGFIHAGDTSNVITTGPSVSLEIPIFDRRQGEIIAARASRQQAIDEYSARIFEARSRAAEIKSRIHISSSHYARVSEAADARKNMVHIYEEALYNGNADVLTYYQALSTLLQRKIELMDIKMGISELTVAMEAVTGVHIIFTEKDDKNTGKKAHTNHHEI